MQIELLAPRTLGLVGPVLAEDADRLLEAIASLAPGGPITLDLTEVNSIDEGGIVAIRRAAPKAHDIGGVLVLLLPSSETLDQIRGSGLDEEPMILVEVLETLRSSPGRALTGDNRRSRCGQEQQPDPEPTFATKGPGQASQPGRQRGQRQHLAQLHPTMWRW